MDTRHKIVTLDSALSIAAGLRESGTPFHVVTGYFDVLLPGLVKRLEQHASDKSLLFAVMLEPVEALLTSAARAELAASLRVINYVIPFAGGPAELSRTEWIEAMQPSLWIQEETAHQESVERLIEHVFERHGLERARRPSH